jgi:hypothetical protein
LNKLFRFYEKLLKFLKTYKNPKKLNNLVLKGVPSKTPLFFHFHLVNNAINAPKQGGRLEGWKVESWENNPITGEPATCNPLGL